MTGFYGAKLLRVNKQLHAEVTDLIQRKFPFVHVEIHDHGELADALQKRLPGLILHSLPAKIASVAAFKHYSMIVRVQNTRPIKLLTVEGIRHLMVVGNAAWTEVVKAIALHDPKYDLEKGEGPQTRTLSYGVQLLKPYDHISSGEHRHIELCQPMFDYWWNDYEKVWIISAFDPSLARTLTTRLRKARWTSREAFWLAMEDLFLQGETKHKLGLIEGAYRRWREAIDLHDMMSVTKNWFELRCSLESLDGRKSRENAIFEMMRTMNGECSSICLDFASNADLANEKHYHAEQALRHCNSTEAWIPTELHPTPGPDRFAEVKRNIYLDMLKAYGILDDIKREDGLVQDINDAAVCHRLGSLVHAVSHGPRALGFFDNTKTRYNADVFMALMRSANPGLHERITRVA